MAAPAAGPSMMGTFGSSMAGSVAGSMLGNAISGSMSGGSAPAAVAAPAGQAPAAPAMCSFETQQFLACMAQTQDDMNQCARIFDQFKMCQVSSMQQQ